MVKTKPSKVPYYKRVTVPLGYEDAVEGTREALAGEGFGVLTEIDVRATFKQKLDVDFRPYVILGACNPPLAHRALSTEPELGLLLPCNVVVYAGDDPDTTIVAAINPVAQLGVAGNPAVASLAEEVQERLERALEAIVVPSPN